MTQLDPETVASLTTMQDQLSSEAASLKATLDQIQSVEDACSSSSLTMEELLVMKDTVFTKLPDATTTQVRLAKVQAALSGIDKLLA